MAPRRQPKSRNATSRAGRVVATAESDSQADDRVRLITRAGVAILLIATIALVCYVRLRLADVPLERDEGEYAYAGQLILKGVPPYAAVYNMKFPGVYYAYAGIMAIFGQTAWGIRVGLLAVHVATVLLIFAWSRRLVGTLAAGAGASIFALLALDRWSMGMFAHATHFVLLPVAGALLILHDTSRAWRLVTAGILIGVALAMKQQAVFFAALVVGLAMWSARGSEATAAGREAIRRGVLVSAGIAAVLVLMVVTLALDGVLGRFWFWTFQYASAYVSVTPASMLTTILPFAWSYITQATAWFWYLGLAGLVLLFVSRWTGHTRVVLAMTFVAAALSIVPGFVFRPHYFILLMPIVGILAGVTVASIDRGLVGALGAVRARVAAIALCVLIAGVHVQQDAHFLFQMAPTELMRQVYQTNPFLESAEVATYLAAHTRPDDRIAVLGSEPQILFYANRPSATGYIYMYSLTERQPFAPRMKEELMREVEAARPAFVVLVDEAGSWVATMQPDNRIVTWANTFPATCYDRAGVVDIDPAGPATIRWDADSVGYQFRFKSKITIFRRQTGAGCVGSP